MPPTSTPTGIGWHTIPVSFGEPVQFDYEYDEDAPEGEREHILLHYGSTDEGGLVIDPMMGLGVALEAAKRLNRQYAGNDTNPQAVQMAINRLAAIPAVQPSLGAAT